MKKKKKNYVNTNAEIISLSLSLAVARYAVDERVARREGRPRERDRAGAGVCVCVCEWLTEYIVIERKMYSHTHHGMAQPTADCRAMHKIIIDARRVCVACERVSYTLFNVAENYSAHTHTVLHRIGTDERERGTRTQ